jgi:hypothetical protein
MSNEGPEFKNEDVKEKLEGKSDPCTGPPLSLY